MGIRSIVAAPLFAAALGVLGLACSSADPDSTGSNSEDVTDSCRTAKIDSGGRCRGADGRFANQSCCDASGVDTAAIDAAVEELQDVFQGSYDATNVGTSEPLDMIREWLLFHYEDEDEVEMFELVENAPEMMADEQTAGTVDPASVRQLAIESVEWTFEWQELPDEEMDALRARAAAAVDAMVEAGAILGYDGWDQSSCAAPTYTLLVLDTKSQAVAGVELTPCEL